MGADHTGSSGSDIRVLCAFNVNIDCVHTLNSDEIRKLSRNIRSISMPSEVRSLDDLAMAILYSMQNGSGCELLIESQLAESLASLFPWNYRMGGNAGNISNVLAALGAEPVVNVPSLTPRQASSSGVG